MAYLSFKNGFRLENEAVLLRPLATADVQYLLPFALHEPELWRFSLQSAAGEAALMQYIDKAVAAGITGTEYPFIVFDKIKNSYAGCTRFYDIQSVNKTLQLGYTWYGKSFQGTGLNKNCKYLLLKAAFEGLDMERVEFRADNENVRSIAAMKSIGCIAEGVLRSHTIKADGRRRDSIVLSILKDEWIDTVKQNLEAKLLSRYIKNPLA